MADTPKYARERQRAGEGQPTETMREYLEVMYYLAARDEPVINARLAEWLRVSAPTVTSMVKRMEERGYVSRNSHGEIQMTSEGFSLAEAMVRRHRILERFLVDVIGLPWHQIHEEAVRMERALSPIMEARIEALVGDSLTCPHGNPIPGNLHSYPGTSRLDQASVGQRFTVQRIAEEAEEETELIQFLQSNNLIPGNQFIVSASSPETGTTLHHADTTIQVPPQLASVIWGNIDP